MRGLTPLEIARAGLMGLRLAIGFPNHSMSSYVRRKCDHFLSLTGFDLDIGFC